MQEKLVSRIKQLFKGEKSTRIIAALGMAGLACILISSWLPHKEDRQEADILLETQYSYEDGEKYAALLEKRLEAMLAKIEGVGNCSVMITVSGSSFSTYAQDSQQYADSESTEINREYVLYDNKEGDSPLIEYTLNPQIVGVIIACEGGEHNVVREQIYEAAGAVLNIPSNRICVVKKTDER